MIDGERFLIEIESLGISPEEALETLKAHHFKYVPMIKGKPVVENVTHALIGFDTCEEKWYGLSEGSYENVLKERKTSEVYNNADSSDNRGYWLNHFTYDEFKVVLIGGDYE